VSELIQKAQELDKAKGLDLETVQANAEHLKKYRRELAKVHALMIRHEDHLPSERDFALLRDVRIAFEGQKLFTITEEFLDSIKSLGGGYGANLLAELGVSWPPEKGWKNKLIGTKITQGKADGLLNYR